MSHISLCLLVLVVLSGSLIGERYVCVRDFCTTILKCLRERWNLMVDNRRVSYKEESW